MLKVTFHPVGKLLYVPNFMTIYSVDVETLHSNVNFMVVLEEKSFSSVIFTLLQVEFLSMIQVVKLFRANSFPLHIST